MSRVPHKNKDKYPFNTEHAKGGSKEKGLRREVKDGDKTKMEALSCFKKLEYQNPTFFKWLMRRKK